MTRLLRYTLLGLLIAIGLIALLIYSLTWRPETKVLKLNFDSVKLEWTDGRLTGLEAGNPSGTISLKCADQEVKAFKRDVKVNAKYRFTKPVEIPPANPTEGPPAG